MQINRAKEDIMTRVITYECKECGCEIVVSGAHESHLRPIYCCGMEVAKISSRQPAKKKTAKKAVRKTAAPAAGKAGGKTAGKKAVVKKKASAKKSKG